MHVSLANNISLAKDWRSIVSGFGEDSRLSVSKRLRAAFPAMLNMVPAPSLKFVPVSNKENSVGSVLGETANGRNVASLMSTAKL